MTGGLIALSGGREGDVGQALLKGDADGARRLLEGWLERFPDRFYLELIRTGREGEEAYIEGALALAQDLDAPVVATNDVRFLKPRDFEAHEARVCIHQGVTLDDPRRPRRYSDQQYLRSPEEMAALFSDIPEALENTVAIAKRCNLELRLGEVHLPDFPIPGGLTPAAYLRQRAEEGLERRLARVPGERRSAYVERLHRELSVIEAMGFPGYFLIVADFIQWAKGQGIPVGPGRGSGAGSLVAYALGITELDPIRYDLLFERFLNPERVSLPDFDVDFCMENRDRVIEYVAERYGRDRVAQIITYGSMAARAVVRDVGRVLGYPYGFVDKIAKLIPFEIGMTLDKALAREAFLKKRYEEEEEVRVLIDLAKSLEGLARNAGKHAGGVVIAPAPLTAFMPLYREEDEEGVVTQLDKDDLEALGLVKFDFLGLRTLTVIQRAVDLARAKAPELDIGAIPLDDPKTFALIQEGKTTAVFQLESRGMKELIRRLRPDRFEDIVALVALFRPGPLQSGMVDDFIDRKHGRAPIAYPHPALEPILKPTYGVILYQEQVMQIAQALAGYTLGQADILRRCIAEGTLILDARTGERIPIESVRPGMEVFALGPDWKFHRVPVKARYDNGVQSVYRIRTRTGRVLELTREHPLLTIEGWRHLCDLSVGDAIAVPQTLGIDRGDDPDPARVKLLAYLIGDGHTLAHKRGKRYAVARFFNKNPEMLQEYQQAASQIGAETVTYTHRRTGVCTITCKGGSAKSPVVSLVKNAGIAALAYEKRIPQEVFRYSPATLALFLGRLWSTDGSIENTRISYSSSSQGLIDDLNLLLIRMGISSIRRSRSTSHRPNCELIISDQKDVVCFSERIGPCLIGPKRERLARLALEARERIRTSSIHAIPAEVISYIKEAKRQSGKSWTQAGEVVGLPGSHLCSGLNLHVPKRALSRHRVALLGKAFASEVLVSLAESEVLWDPIVEITLVGKKPVYDLEVPPFANFVAQDIVVHNSMGKKKPEEMAKQRAVFVQGAVERGVDKDKAEYIFDLMEKFAGYGFNRSHSAAYALLSYQTAWLKAHYPAEFMAAVLSSDMDHTDKVVGLLEECKAMGLAVLPPDINASDYAFTVEEDGKLRYGLGAIKGVGAAALEGILKARTAPFKDLFDFTARIDTRKANRRVLEALIRAGALDGFGERGMLMANLDKALEFAEHRTTAQAVGQSDLFGSTAPLPEATLDPSPPWSEEERLQGEKETLGFYLSGHPLSRFKGELAQFTVPLDGLRPDQGDAVVGGWVVALRTTSA
ncbi:MAG: DNA polymerase III subunit alpha, partial [Gammaproteobacteria bacterium]